MYYHKILNVGEILVEATLLVVKIQYDQYIENVFIKMIPEQKIITTQTFCKESHISSGKLRLVNY